MLHIKPVSYTHLDVYKRQILNRLAIGDGGESSKNTNPINFYNGDQLVYQQKAQYDPLDYPLTLTNLIVGIGYMDSNEKLVNEPCLLYTSRCV